MIKNKTEDRLVVEKESDRILTVDADGYGVTLGLPDGRIDLSPHDVVELIIFLGGAMNRWEEDEI
jgi:hypothetical protein